MRSWCGSGNVALPCARSSVHSNGRRGSRFHEWDATAVKSHRWVNLYQLTPIIASARAEIRGQNEPTLACQPISPSQRAPCTPPHTTHPRSQLDTTFDATVLSLSPLLSSHSLSFQSLPLLHNGTSPFLFIFCSLLLLGKELFKLIQ